MVEFSSEVFFYDSSGHPLRPTVVDSELRGTGSGNNSDNWVLQGRMTSPAGAAFAAVAIIYKNTATVSSTFTGWFFGVTFSQTPQVAVTNNGIRETPAVITLNGNCGGSQLFIGSIATILLTFFRWMTLTGHAVTIDMAKRTITGVDGGGTTGIPGSLQGLSPQSTWQNPPAGGTTVYATGLLVGASFSVALRDAY